MHYFENYLIYQVSHHANELQLATGRKCDTIVHSTSTSSDVTLWFLVLRKMSFVYSSIDNPLLVDNLRVSAIVITMTKVSTLTIQTLEMRKKVHLPQTQTKFAGCRRERTTLQNAAHQQGLPGHWTMAPNIRPSARTPAASVVGWTHRAQCRHVEYDCPNDVFRRRSLMSHVAAIARHFLSIYACWHVSLTPEYRGSKENGSNNHGGSCRVMRYARGYADCSMRRNNNNSGMATSSQFLLLDFQRCCTTYRNKSTHQILRWERSAQHIPWTSHP